LTEALPLGPLDNSCSESGKVDYFEERRAESKRSWKSGAVKYG